MQRKEIVILQGFLEIGRCGASLKIKQDEPILEQCQPTSNLVIGNGFSRNREAVHCIGRARYLPNLGGNTDMFVRPKLTFGLFRVFYF